MFCTYSNNLKNIIIDNKTQKKNLTSLIFLLSHPDTLSLTLPSLCWRRSWPYRRFLRPPKVLWSSSPRRRPEPAQKRSCSLPIRSERVAWSRDATSLTWLSNHPVVRLTFLQLPFTSPHPQLPRSALEKAKTVSAKLVA